MKYRELLKYGNDYMIENNKEESGALFLLEYAANKTSPELFSLIDAIVPDDIINKYKEALDEHVKKNRPVWYIVGTAPFYGYDFNVTEDVLIPRFETEELVEHVLEYYDKYFKGQKVDVADVATGSGCIGVTLKLEEPNMNVTITDISDKALEVAASNAKKLGADVKILQGDMVKPIFGNKFDILVSNPPYIPEEEEVQDIVKDNEPNIALFGGKDGLKFYRIIFEDSKMVLKDKFIMAFEHGFDKKEAMVELAKKYYPNANVISRKDLEGKDRMTFVINGFDDEE